MEFLKYGSRERNQSMRKYITAYAALLQLIFITSLLVMSWRKLCLLILLVLVEQTTTQNIRSAQMTLINGQQMMCANTTCLPFSTVIVSGVLQCQMNCLIQTECKTASFHRLFFNCTLFAYKPNVNETIFVDMNIVLMVVVDGTRIPSG